MAIEAGRLRERITLQRKSVTRDAVGGEVVTWVEEAVLWAEVAPIRGREYLALRAAQSDVVMRFRLRYRAGVNPAMRVVWNGGEYDIVEAIDVGARRTELELLCRGAAENV